ncbi:putative leucine-rich repeat domain superfamily [Helianthus annuus]|uniref:Leucine-rich repeat domain superfamily n=1 Tax=Helianthus annuus TaxID=4232 RepID=A0A9K3J293_HELAN|nr:putative leucine-rich repeat domain superfamily [Helianthus annuus]
MFPKVYKLTKGRLIRLLVSNGFIPPKGEISLYVLGEEVFSCLVWRSFFIVKEDEFQEDLYVIHDLMHDMAQHVTGDDCLVIKSSKEVIVPNEVLHLTSSCPGFLFWPHDLKNLTSLRSIFLYGKINEGSIKQIFNHVYVRVLYLAGIQVKTLPESSCKLKHLKYLNLCFAYCCMFSKGYKLTKGRLIWLWVSNGFIPPKGKISLYVLGEEVFSCLVWRSFFIVKEDEFQKDLYVIHDLMHDMAQHVMGDDCLVIKSGKEVIVPNEVLHLTSLCPGFLFWPHDLKKLTSLRSIFLYGKINEGSIKQIFNYVYVRVLYLAGIQLKTLSESSSKLKHLKYLNLSRSSIQVLHESITYLQNLQVLLLYHCKFLCKLPKGLRYMSNLRIFNFYQYSIFLSYVFFKLCNVCYFNNNDFIL